MRKSVIVTAGCMVLLAVSPALAQGRGGGQGGGRGGGIGAGPPMTQPSRMGGGLGTANAARDLGAQRGRFGRDFAAQRRLTAEQRQQRVADYRSRAAQQRAHARELADLSRNARLPENARGRIRDAMIRDLDEWRDAFGVERDQWQAMRNQWIVDRDSLTAGEWAQRRADWFAARDAWNANQRAWAQARGE